MTTAERRAAARARAQEYGGVLSRRLLRELGIDARMVRREIAAERWRRHGRQTVAVHSGELDFAAACRDRGVPEPERQHIRRGPHGAVYLDVRWRNGLVVEIDGAAHRQSLAVAHDSLRANDVTLDEEMVLHIDLVGYRLFQPEFLDQVCAGYWIRHRRTA